MDRRTFLMKSALAAVALGVPGPRLLANTLQPSKGTFKTLRRHTGYFTEMGGTIGWLAAPDALVAIDSQFPDSAPHCLAGLRQRTDHPMDLLINTHHHRDHTGGNGVFSKATDTIVAQQNVPELQKQAYAGNDELPPQTYANKLFEKEWTTDVGDETLRARHYGPAHTGGDAVVLLEKANVVHMGDLVFNRWYPVIDRPGGASIRNWVSTLETVIRDYPDDALYIYGHGNPKFGVSGRKEDLGVMRDYLSHLLDTVQKDLQAGKSKEEIMNRGSFEQFPDFTAPSKRLTLAYNLEVAYNELTNAKREG